MSGWRDLDRRSVLVGVSIDVLITFPAGLIGRSLGEDSNAAVVCTLLVLAAPFVAGLVAARGHRNSTLIQGGAAAGLAWAVVIAVSVAAKLIDGRGIPLMASLTLGVWSVSLGLIGGYVTFRREIRAAPQ